MIWLFLAGCGIFVLLAILLREFLAQSPEDLARAVRVFVVVFTSLASAGLLFAGRVGLAVALAGATIYAIRTLRKSVGSVETDTEAPTSKAETDFLRMTLDLASQEMEGSVRKGQFAGRRLADLAENDLLALRREILREDPTSVSLIEAYLQFRSVDWHKHGANADTEGSDPCTSGMSTKEAYEILGLDETATVNEIKRAHKTLMARLHPDLGGSNYLSAKINEAKDHLIALRRKR